MKDYGLYLLIVFILFLGEGCSQPSTSTSLPRLQSSHRYASILEKLLYYKKDRFSVFYGGPVTSSGVQWLMMATFEDEKYQTRACYEIAFVNCNLQDAEDASIYFLNIPEIDIKFKNERNSCYKKFEEFSSGKYSPEKYILIRLAEVAMPFYPNIYISSLCEAPKYDKDKETIAHFLSENFKTKAEIVQIDSEGTVEEIDFQSEKEVFYKPVQFEMAIEDRRETFYLGKRILLRDPWKIYYVIVCNPALLVPSSTSFMSEECFVRLDSGCTSGQIYNDSTCDCLDQLHESLTHLSKFYANRGMVIHMPTHDGRGFGFALKAETEIYKQGGRGRVHTTESLDTIAAAQHLYQSEEIDLRTFDGAAYILKQLGVREITLFTDNRSKAQSLENYEFKINRITTNTTKESCREHLKAKKKHAAYYSD